MQNADQCIIFTPGTRHPSPKALADAVGMRLVSRPPLPCALACGIYMYSLRIFDRYRPDADRAHAPALRARARIPPVRALQSENAIRAPGVHPSSQTVNSMTEKEKMLAGLPYDGGDPELMRLWYTGKNLARAYNQCDYADTASQRRILRELLGSVGENIQITAPFYVDYGAFICIGENTEINMNCVFLDCNYIRIGNNTLIAPGVHIYTVFHPVRAQERFPRRSAAEFNFAVGLTKPVTIGDSVWIGGGSVILPGVEIGDDVTIGAGSVVTKSIPPGVLAYGNPCRVVKTL